MKIASKVFVVTGGGNGIGRELTLALLKKGARVAAVDISEKALQETVRLAGSLGEQISTHVVNITDRAAVEALPAAVLAAHGGLVDGLVNCAGIIQPFVKFKDLSYADIERMINVNFYGMVYMTKTFLPYLLSRPEGHIVNISSMGGFLPVPGQTMYGASKAATKLFTEGLYAELIDTHVHVTTVFPGAIGTNIAANSGVSAPGNASAETSAIKMTSPQVAAEEIIKGIERDSFQVFVGSDSKMMNFIYRLMPKRATRIIYNQMRSLLQ
jgi:short-subunit dehydrogenase